MTIKKSVNPRLPPVHPGLQQKIREAEDAEAKGVTPRTFGDAQKVLRPSLDTLTVERGRQAQAIGLVEPAYRAKMDGRLAIAEQAAYRPDIDLDAAWDTLSEADKIKAGATERFRLEMEATLENAMMPHELPHKITGRLDARQLKRSEENIDAELNAVSYLLAPDVYQHIKRFVRETRDLIETCLKQRAIEGLDAIQGYGALRDLTHKLIYQELVSKRRMMGDRGVRRIASNIDLAETLYGQLKRQPGFSLRDRLLMRVIHVHQDIGHTAYAARVSFRGSRLHRAYGARIFTDEMNRYRTLLMHDEIELVRHAIATHSSEELPLAEKRVLALVRAVDHLAPFGLYKSYKFFEGLQHIDDYLGDLLKHARAKDVTRWSGGRDGLRMHLGSLDLAPPLRDDLHASFRPLDRDAELVDIAPLAGIVDDIQIDLRDGGTVRAKLAPDPFAHKYQALFDAQQEQLLRLTRVLEMTPKQFDEPVVRFQKPGFGALEIVRG